MCATINRQERLPVDVHIKLKYTPRGLAVSRRTYPPKEHQNDARRIASCWNYAFIPLCARTRRIWSSSCSSISYTQHRTDNRSRVNFWDLLETNCSANFYIYTRRERERDLHRQPARSLGCHVGDSFDWFSWDARPPVNIPVNQYQARSIYIYIYNKPTYNI